MRRRPCCGRWPSCAAVLDGISHAPNLAALRRLLRELFEKVWYLPEGHPWLRDLESEGIRESGAAVPGALLWPWLNESAIERWEPDYSDAWKPACGHADYDPTCADCEALMAEPYSPDDPESTPVIRKAVLALDEQPLREALAR